MRKDAGIFSWRGPCGPLRRVLPTALFLLGWQLAVECALAVPAGGVQPRSTIRGTVILNGCDLDPQSITIVATPITSVGGPELPRQHRIRTPDRMRSVQARVRAARAGREMPFTIEVASGALYKLYIGVPPESCGKVFWRGPSEGLAVGGRREIKIEGFAARTELELLDPRTDGWVGADHLDFMDRAAALRTLRWRTTIEGVDSAELQLSTEPFPISGNFGSCDEVEGAVVHRRQLEVVEREQWQELPEINFNALLVPSRMGNLSTVDQAAFKRLAAGSPIYLRVVPIVAGKPACDIATQGVHGWVIMSKLPGVVDLSMPTETEPPEIEASGEQMYIPPRVDGGPSAGHPTYIETAYKVIKPHLLPPKRCSMATMTKKQFNYYFYNDPLGCLLVNSNAVQPGTLLDAGRWFWFSQQKSSSGSSNPLVSFGSSLVGLGTAFSSALGGAANYFSQLSQEIESAVTNVITEVVTTIDILDGCSALKNAGLSCKSLVKAGLKVGMTSLGVPPVSIPNWEQIQSQGFDYLAGAMANEIANATGVPAELTQEKLRELAETAAAKAIDELTKKRGGGTLGYDWVIPYNGFDPAILRISLRETSADGLPIGMHLLRKDNDLFLGGNLRIPHIFPTSKEMKIPIVLPMNIASIVPPLCKTNRYLQTTCVPNSLLKEPACLVETNDSKGVYHWSGWSCQFSPYPAIYYRDRWIELLKGDATSCVNLWSSLFATAGSLYIPFPAPQLIEFFRVKASQWFAWNGPVYFASSCSL